MPLAPLVLALTMGLSAPMVGEDRPAAADPQVTIVSAPDRAVEGDRLDFTIKVGAARRAKWVQLQERQADYFGDLHWVTVESARVRGTARHTLHAVADGIDSERYRARATYRDGSADTSTGTTVTVWRWISLNDFDAYYETYGVRNDAYLQFPMNGSQRKGWYTTGSYRFWEARYTPGRNCRSFRADLGVNDSSLDGSSGSITLLTDDGAPLFTSPPLVPGVVESIELDLDLPYRFWVQAADTSTEELEAWPAMGDAAFLCTGN